MSPLNLRIKLYYNFESRLRNNIFIWSQSKTDNKGTFQIGGSFVSFHGWNNFFQSHPTKREKKFLLKNNDQIDLF